MERLRTLFTILSFLFSLVTYSQPVLENLVVAKDMGTFNLPFPGEDCFEGNCYSCDVWKKYNYGYACNSSVSCSLSPGLSDSPDIISGYMVFVPSQLGSFTYQLRRKLLEMDPNGCIVSESGPFDYSTFEITVIDWKWVGSLDAYCSTDDVAVELDALISHSEGVNYSGPGVLGGLWNAAEAGVGTHTITARKPFSNGTKTISLEVVVHPNPNVTFDDPPTYCKNGSNPNLMDFVSPAGGTFDHTYGNSLDLYGTSNQRVDLASSAPGTYDVRYSYTDGNGCSTTTTATVTIDPPITIDAGANQEACTGSGAITLVSASSGVSWSCVGCDFVHNGSFDTNDAPPGTYTVRAYQSSGGCSDSDDKTFTVKVIPDVRAGSDLEVCLDAGSFSLEGASPTGGVWSGSCGGCLGGDVFDPVAAGPGDHEFTYTYTNAQGCTANDQRIVRVHGLPNSDAIETMGDERCGSGQVVLEAQLEGHSLLWYSTHEGGDPLHSGSVFKPTISVGSVSYFVEAVSSFGCVSPNRHVVTATAFDIPEAPVSVDVTRCGSGVVELAASGGEPGTVFSWYENPTGGSALATGSSFESPFLDNSRSYYVSATSPDGCLSTSRTEVTAHLSIVPGLPTVFDAANCGAGSVSLRVGGAPAGGTYAWYAVPSGESSFHTENSWDTPELEETTTYWVSIVNADGCEGPRAEITARIIDPPSAPSVIDGERCGAGSLELGVEGEEQGVFNWYVTAFSTSIIHTGSTYSPDLEATSSYWVSFINAQGCESERSEVRAVVHPIPEAPEVPSAYRCGPGSVSLSAGGDYASFEWFDQPVGGVLLHTGRGFEVAVTETRSFYVESITTSGCHSIDRTQVTATVHSFPGSPLVFGGSTCGEGSVLLHVGGAPAGGSFRWYEVEEGGESFHDSDRWETPLLAETAKYYVSIVNATGCEGERSAIQATVHEVPSPPIGQVVERCGEGRITFNLSSDAGTTVRWYETENSVSNIHTGDYFITPELVETRSYYATFTDAQGCESERSEVRAVVHPIPEVPLISDAGRCGEGEVLLEVSPTEGMEYLWYDAPTGGDLLFTGDRFEPSVQITRNFYVEARSEAACTSIQRTPVTVTIHAFPGPPVVFDASRCGDGPVDLFVGGASAGGSYYWYEEASGGSPFYEGEHLRTDSLFATTTYYVSLISSEGCEGSRVPVTGSIEMVPGAPEGIAGSRCGPGEVELGVQSDDGTLFSWYETAVSTTRLFEGREFHTPSLESSTSFWVAVSNASGCEGPRVEVLARVDAVPAAPIAEGVSRCAAGLVTLEVSGGSSDATYHWYLSSDDVVAVEEGTVVDFDVSGSRDYYVSVESSMGCIGPKAKVPVTINEFPSAPTVESGSICGSGRVILNAGGAPLGGTYKWYSSESSLDTLYSGIGFQTDLLVNSRGYWVSVVTAEGCEGPRTKVDAVVYPVPERPVGIDASHCGVGSVSLEVQSPVMDPTYHWYFEESGGQPFWDGAFYTIDYLTQTTSYWVSVVTPTGCESSRERVTATFLPTNPVPIGNDTSLCIQSGPLVLRYHAPDGGVFTGPGVVDGLFYPSIAGIGTHLVGYSLVNALGCETEGQRIITVLSDRSGGEGLDVGTSPYPICLDGGSVDLSAFPNIAGGEWSGDGVTLSTFDPVVAGAGTTTLLYAVEVNGCEVLAEKEIVVLQEPDVPVLHAEEVGVCAGDLLDLSILTPDPDLTYLWFEDGSSTVLASGEVLQQEAIDDVRFLVVAEDAFGCRSASATIAVDVRGIDADFDVSNRAVGIAERVDFELDYSGEGTFLWDFGDGLTSVERDPSHYYYEDGVFSVSVQVLADGCEEVIVKEDLVAVRNDFATGEVVLGLHDSLPEVAVYPQPFDEVLVVRLEGFGDASVALALYDLNGSLTPSPSPLRGGPAMQKQRWASQPSAVRGGPAVSMWQMDTHMLPAGVYLLRVWGEEYEEWYKVVKE